MVVLSGIAVTGMMILCMKPWETTVLAPDAHAPTQAELDSIQSVRAEKHAAINASLRRLMRSGIVDRLQPTTDRSARATVGYQFYVLPFEEKEAVALICAAWVDSGQHKAGVFFHDRQTNKRVGSWFPGTRLSVDR